MALRYKEGVVAKATLAFLLIDDRAFHGALECGEHLPVFCESHRAPEASGAFLAAGTCAFQLLEELRAVAGIRGTVA